MGCLYEHKCSIYERKKVVKYKSCFDVIGPIMIGPSSSHTAGALSIGTVANKLFQGLPKSCGNVL